MRIFKEITLIPAYVKAVYMAIIINVVVFVFCVLSVIPSVFVLLLFKNPVLFYLEITEDVRKTSVSWGTMKEFIKNKRESRGLEKERSMA